MRTHILLFLSLAVAVSLPVQDWVPVESLVNAQRERNPLLADVLPEQGHVVQEDPHPVARKETIVLEKHAEPQPVQQNEPVKVKGLVEDVRAEKKAEVKEVVEETKPKEEPVMVEPRDQKQAPIEQVENISPLKEVPETAEKQEEALMEAEEEPVMGLEAVPDMQEFLEMNPNGFEGESVIELEPDNEKASADEERNVMQEEALMEAAEERVMELEPVPDMQDVREMNRYEFVDEPLMEPVEEERHAFQEEPLLEAGYLADEAMVPYSDGAERSAMLEAAVIEPEYQMDEDPVLQFEPSNEFSMQEYPQRNEYLAESQMMEDVRAEKKAEVKEVVEETEPKEEPIMVEPRDQKQAPTEQVENISLLKEVPETAEKQEEALIEAEESVMGLEAVPDMQEVLEMNPNGFEGESVIELELDNEKASADEERNVMQEEALMEAAEEPVMELEPVPDMQEVREMNRYEFVDEPLMEPVEEERHAFQEEPLLEAGYLADEAMVPYSDGAERSAMLEAAVIEPEYQMDEDPVLQFEPSNAFSMQEYPQRNEYLAESQMMERQIRKEDLMTADQSYMEDSLENNNLKTNERAVAEKETVQKEQSNNRGRTCNGVVISGKCYQFFRGPKRAADAEFFCQRNFPNGHLASVTSSYIHSQMLGLMDRNGGRTRTLIGGLRYLDTGRFIWLDGAHWDYAAWLPGEPNDAAGVENCVELLSNGKFNDLPRWDLRAFICSYPF